MATKSRSFTLIALVVTLAAELAIGLSGLDSAQAAKFKPPNRGAPKATSGGGTRSGSCMKEKTPLTVLVPPSKTGKENVALTTETHPTFFVYLPKTTAQAAEFVLLDDDDKDVYSGIITLPGKSGIVSFQLPADAPPLELGKYYQWYFNVVCQPTDRLRDAFVGAWIQRIEPPQTLVSALKTATPRKHPDLYAQASLWQDTLTTLSELQRSKPNDITLFNEWNLLLKDVGLGQLPGGPPAGKLRLKVIKEE